jgi:hypothetical protein
MKSLLKTKKSTQIDNVIKLRIFNKNNKKSLLSENDRAFLFYDRCFIFLFPNEINDDRRNMHQTYPASWQ